MVFGAPLDQVTEKNLQRLVDEGASEHSDLEFKEEPYGNSDSDRRELAADIAQFANDRGGVIVIGMQEGKELATECRPVPLDSKECDRMLAIAAERVVPYAPFEPRTIPCDGDGTRGYYLLLVPPSPDRPHAVRNGKDLRYPRRNGTQKRWLAESEIADAYRDRFTRASGEVARVDRVIEEGVARLRVGEDFPYLILALAPSQSVSFQVDVASMKLTEDWARQQAHLYGQDLFSGPFEHPPGAGVGVRRILLGTSMGDRLDTSYGYMEIHSDGAAFAAGRLYPPQANALPRSHNDDANEQKFTAPVLTQRVVGCLRAAASASIEKGAFGDCAVIVELRGQRMRLVEYDAGYFERKLGEAASDGPLRSRHTLTLESLASMSTDLLIATRQVCADLVQAFGTPELSTITSDGHLMRSAFPSNYHEQLTTFSGRTAIPLAN
ncbi:MAG: AlbA family DNA-binding domain-containing protein [Solirubrobacteraceae bacterium]